MVAADVVGLESFFNTNCLKVTDEDMGYEVIEICRLMRNPCLTGARPHGKPAPPESRLVRCVMRSSYATMGLQVPTL